MSDEFCGLLAEIVIGGVKIWLFGFLVCVPFKLITKGE